MRSHPVNEQHSKEFEYSEALTTITECYLINLTAFLIIPIKVYTIQRSLSKNRTASHREPRYPCENSKLLEIR